jgi:hypothetical protein
MYIKQGKKVKETHYKKWIGFRLKSRFHISNILFKTRLLHDVNTVSSTTNPGEKYKTYNHHLIFRRNLLALLITRLCPPF